MKRLWIDTVAIIAFAVVLSSAILFGGKFVGIETHDAVHFGLFLVTLCTLICLMIATLTRLSQWPDSMLNMEKWSRARTAEMTGAPGQSSLAGRDPGTVSAKDFTSLYRALRGRYGLRWRYRQPWLLLSGADTAIKQLFPELAEHGWLITHDAVLLYCPSGSSDQPDAAWLKQLYRLRRRRPVDAIVLTLDGEVTLPAQRRGSDAQAVHLAHIAEALHWAAPIFVLDVAQTDCVRNGHTPVIGCTLPCDANSSAIETALLSLRIRLDEVGVAQLVRNGADRYAAALAERLDTRSVQLAQWIAMLAAYKPSSRGQRRQHQPISGVYFAPYPRLNTTPPTPDQADSASLPLWHHLATQARRAPGHRMAHHPLTLASLTGLALVCLWTAGMLVAGFTNVHELAQARGAEQALAGAPTAALRLRALLAVQQEIDHYESRTLHRTPILTRFGLNRDREILAALWPRYAQASRRDLIMPVQQRLESQLAALGQMSTGTTEVNADQLARTGHANLETYLMLADPSHADAATMKPQLLQDWHTEAVLSTGDKLDLSERLLGFYAQHLKAHPAWRITARPELVQAARQTLLALIGVRDSADTLYQGVLASAGKKYPDQTLVSLTAGTDPRGLLRTTANVPGVFTRAAFEGTIATAIEAAANRRDVASDWVLAPNVQPDHRAHIPGRADHLLDSQEESSLSRDRDNLQAVLTRRYFADYAEHWQAFMNSLQWEPATTLPAAIEQLKLAADARQSPVIALLQALAYQGGAGAHQDTLADTLVSKAQHVFGGASAPLAQADPAGPLSATFGPLLQLVGQGTAAANTRGDLSQQRYLERITALRLVLQQISQSPDPDAQARQVAQALFQGKGSELAETQDYAQLVAASLGEQWAGAGQALFVQPVTQAIRTVLQPAQASLNQAWQQAILANWESSFTGRYPFADTDNDASLPELARFLRPQGGLIPAFLSAQLAGVLELQGDRWVPVATGSQALAFDPAFLTALNTLQHIAGHLLVQGEPAYHFEFKPIPTPGITDTVLTLDGQTLHYFNQRETWQALSWPAATQQLQGTRLQWQTEQAGTAKNFEFNDRWGLLRMLERARVEPLDDATYQLTWQAMPDATMAPPSASPTPTDIGTLNPHGPLTPASPELSYPVRYLMRTEVGQGPLELLALRGFVLPPRIFLNSAPGSHKTAQAETLPPVPQAMLDQAAQIHVPLPAPPGSL